MLARSTLRLSLRPTSAVRYDLAQKNAQSAGPCFPKLAEFSPYPARFYTPTSKDEQSSLAAEEKQVTTSAITSPLLARFVATAEVTVSKIFPAGKRIFREQPMGWTEEFQSHVLGGRSLKHAQ